MREERQPACGPCACPTYTCIARVRVYELCSRSLSPLLRNVRIERIVACLRCHVKAGSLPTRPRPNTIPIPSTNDRPGLSSLIDQSICALYMYVWVAALGQAGLPVDYRVQPHTSRDRRDSMRLAVGTEVSARENYRHLHVVYCRGVTKRTGQNQNPGSILRMSIAPRRICPTLSERRRDASRRVAIASRDRQMGAK